MKIGDNIENEFNAFSSNYTNDMIKCVPHYLELISSFSKDLPENFNPSLILDLGCGNGNVTSSLLELYPRSTYVLLDASQQMLDLCKHQFKSFDVEYIKTYFQDYKFEDDHFDMINAGFSIHHCDPDEKKTLFKSIYSSLKKGGVFGYSDLMINKDNPYHLTLLKEWKAFVNKNYSDGEMWNWLMEHYDEFDQPNDHQIQIKWLEQTGFKNNHYITKEDHWVHIRSIKE